MGDPACQGAQVQVFENNDSIEVNVRVGELPGVSFEDCSGGVGNFYTEVALESPRGERQISLTEPLEPGEDAADFGDPAQVEPPLDGDVEADIEVDS